MEKQNKEHASIGMCISCVKEIQYAVLMTSMQETLYLDSGITHYQSQCCNLQHVETYRCNNQKLIKLK